MEIKFPFLITCLLGLVSCQAFGTYFTNRYYLGSNCQGNPVHIYQVNYDSDPTHICNPINCRDDTTGALPDGSYDTICSPLLNASSGFSRRDHIGNNGMIGGFCDKVIERTLVHPSFCRVFGSYYLPTASSYRTMCVDGIIYEYSYNNTECFGIGAKSERGFTSKVCVPIDLTSNGRDVECPTLDCGTAIESRMAQYATAAYTRQQQNYKVRIGTTSIDTGIIVAQQRGWRTLLRGQEWYMVRDLCLDALVIVIRGTVKYNPSDLLDDLTYDADPLEEGYVHSGFNRRANRILEEINSVYGMDNLATEHPTIYILLGIPLVQQSLLYSHIICRVTLLQLKDMASEFLEFTLAT